MNTNKNNNMFGAFCNDFEPKTTKSKKRPTSTPECRRKIDDILEVRKLGLTVAEYLGSV